MLTLNSFISLKIYSQGLQNFYDFIKSKLEHHYATKSPLLSIKTRVVILCVSPPLTHSKTPLESSFCFHTKKSQFPIDYIVCAWPLKCGMTPPTEPRAQSRFVLNEKFAPTSLDERECKKFENLKSFSQLHMRHEKLSQTLKGRVKKRIYDLFLFAKNDIALTDTLRLLW